MEKYIHQLSKRSSSTNEKWLNANVIRSDVLTRHLFSYADDEIQNLKHIFKASKRVGFESQYKLSQANNSMDLATFIEKAKGDVDDVVLKDLANFAKNPNFDCKDKSILSIIWAKIMSNATEKKIDLNDELTDLFFSVIEKSTDNEVTLDEVLDETISIFKNQSEVSTYLNLVFIDLKDDTSYYDYSTYPAVELDEEEIEYDIEINDEEDLLNALKDFKNLPAVIEFIKENYLNDKNEKDDGYCEDDLIRDYKAYYIALKLTDDKRFKDDPEFDKNNNIGLNLNAKLYATEKLILEEHSNFKNSNVFSKFKKQSSKIATYSIFGKEQKKANEFKSWITVINRYISKCKIVAKKVKEGDYISTRDYLKTMGLVKDYEQIKNPEAIVRAIREKANNATLLRDDYLKKSSIDGLYSDPFIDEADKLYEELSLWETEIKQEQPKAYKMPKHDKIVTLGEYVSISRIRPEGTKTAVKKFTQTTKYANNDSTQLTIEGLDSLIPPQTDKDDSHASEIE